MQKGSYFSPWIHGSVTDCEHLHSEMRTDTALVFKMFCIKSCYSVMSLQTHGHIAHIFFTWTLKPCKLWIHFYIQQMSPSEGHIHNNTFIIFLHRTQWQTNSQHAQSARKAADWGPPSGNGVSRALHEGNETGLMRRGQVSASALAPITLLNVKQSKQR